MIAVIGSFRLPVDALERARPLMRTVIAATLTEPGCRDYAYAEDVADPGLIRVSELWDDRPALAAHFDTPHMRRWIEQRAVVGLSERSVIAYEVGEGETL